MASSPEGKNYSRFSEEAEDGCVYVRDVSRLIATHARQKRLGQLPTPSVSRAAMFLRHVRLRPCAPLDRVASRI